MLNKVDTLQAENSSSSLPRSSTPPARTLKGYDGIHSFPPLLLLQQLPLSSIQCILLSSASSIDVTLAVTVPGPNSNSNSKLDPNPLTLTFSKHRSNPLCSGRSLVPVCYINTDMKMCICYGAIRMHADARKHQIRCWWHVFGLASQASS